ncbi:Sec-independent protein translocase subunit TatA [Nocardia donostiensis]|uniref:Sec-independent protein translocase protein TatA n=1 Tax=Nocardia donostiensis TaxID=1538463 RepID=A0A1V2TKZ6_9NOCA|nr:Sec-independent protein translocase subunit TatA [Nocardia donostiensis]ONM50169.1 Sec-independent protein translocase TatA [Nocardia donostiensis]OQS15830.1 Sec-independent protein translocase TatA [Nocardia donostiensis]OQS23636.1 Sec-independent protein translocase TatA [Nocardia donostiensis]
MGSLSIWHWLIIAVVFVVFFGAKRMPDAARSLGRSLRIFKSEVSQMQNEGNASAGSPGTAAQQPPQQLPSGQQATTAPETRSESKTL